MKMTKRTPQQIGRSNKQRGYRVELEFAKLIGGERVYKSGALSKLGEELAGDVVGLGLRWEIKARKNGFKKLHEMLRHFDAVLLRTEGKATLIAMKLEKFMYPPEEPYIGEKYESFKMIRDWLEHETMVDALAIKTDRHPFLVIIEQSRYHEWLFSC
jgi:hypothetical protein